MAQADVSVDGNRAFPNDSKNTYVTSEVYMNQLNQREFDILIPSFIVILVVVIVGIPGNIITVLVYLKKMRRTASRVFILALAFCDLVNCLFTMPVEIYIIATFWTFDHPILCSISRTLTYILNGTSALLLVGIAVDRFRKICRPLKPVFTPKQTKRICIVSCALGFAVYIPGFVLYGTRTEEMVVGPNLIAVGKTCQINDKYHETRIRNYIIGFWFLLTVSVMVVLIIMYCMIGRAVYKRLKLEERRHNSMSSTNKSHRKRQVMTDQSSETSCSFDDNRKHTGGGDVLKSVPEQVKSAISQRLMSRFSMNHANMYTVNRDRAAQRIRAGRTTLMLFSVTIAYILSFIPFVAIVVTRSASNPHYYTMISGAEKAAWNVFLRSYVLNCAVNPILYGFFNKDFRKKMLELFHDCFNC